jgi:hypothetical protein
VSRQSHPDLLCSLPLDSPHAAPQPHSDSHMKSTYAATRCLMLDFWNTTQGECAASSDPAEQLELHRAEMFAPRNLTLLDYTEPRCVHLIGGGRICFLHAVRGEVLVSGDKQVGGRHVVVCMLAQWPRPP